MFVKFLCFWRFTAIKDLQLNTWGTNFHPELAVTKQLFCQKIQKLIISGVSTDMTVQLTAREDHDRDDACGTNHETIHKTTIETLARIANIINSKQLVKTDE